MAKEALITMKSVQWYDTESSEIELITTGTFEPVDGGGYKISYEEYTDLAPGSSRTDLTCFGNRLANMIRSGTDPTSFIIEKDRKHHCHYGSQFGEFTLGVYTHIIENNLTEGGGDVYLKYTVDINSSYISDNEIFLNVKL